MSKSIKMFPTVSLRSDKLLVLSLLLLIAFSSCRSSFSIPKDLTTLESGKDFSQSYRAFELDQTYRFELEAHLVFKKMNMKGMMMMSEKEGKFWVQYFSDFGKNLMLLSKDLETLEWEVHYVLPEMDYEGLKHWIQEDLEVLVGWNIKDVFSNLSTREGIAYLKNNEEEGSIVYLLHSKGEKPYKALLLNEKNKILKTYEWQVDEVDIQYHRPSVRFKYQALHVTE